MRNHDRPTPPPVRNNAKGDPRRVGVEIEFAGVTVRDAARLVHDHFGGQIDQPSAHRAKITDTPFGDFTVELDAQVVHPDGAAEGKGDLGEKILGKDFDARAREALGHAVSALVPCEIVAPPIPWDRLGELNPLCDALRGAGAEGTDANPLYGFGLHLNPEVAEESAAYALKHLQAFVILADWLRECIEIDPTRRLLPHIDPFPKAYIKRILRPDYAPDLETLIRDYAADNPTRNRELDMTVLFRHLDEDTLVAVMDDVDLIKARPTFHYRLPNASLSDPDWNAVVEWNRWVKVEELAANDELLAQRAAEYLAYLDQPLSKRWLDNLNAWLDK